MDELETNLFLPMPRFSLEVWLGMGGLMPFRYPVNPADDNSKLYRNYVSQVLPLYQYQQK